MGIPSTPAALFFLASLLIEISIKQSNNRAVIRIKDNGQGISAKDISQVFKEGATFHRAAPTHGTVSLGSTKTALPELISKPKTKCTDNTGVVPPTITHNHMYRIVPTDKARRRMGK